MADEYINKEEAIKVVFGCKRYTGIDEAPFEYADDLLNKLPTIDIVHCYECRWLNDKGKANCFIREKTGICRTSFFCAEGERREDD